MNVDSGACDLKRHLPFSLFFRTGVGFIYFCGTPLKITGPRYQGYRRAIHQLPPAFPFYQVIHVRSARNFRQRGLLKKLRSFCRLIISRTACYWTGRGGDGSDAIPFLLLPPLLTPLRRPPLSHSPSRCGVMFVSDDPDQYLDPLHAEKKKKRKT
ncbi:hypothetical protein B0T19DRAFT_160370 [Cercophora scortea]|uniref:Uncharacterized protein n=1 Tax=Cercophora scortea TaxID=314031 RepID=A0AAE0ILN1_9PEZI|nr:hypothetical protein B0T19DRAFT_160370 [Cercophora scortea]